MQCRARASWRRVWVVVGLGWLLAACDRVAPPPAVEQPAPAPSEPAPPSVAATCELRYELAIDPVGPAGQLGLHASAVNLTSRPLIIEVPDACPDGVVRFTGLPDGTDVYGTCTAGVCQDGLPPKRFELAPGARVVLADAYVPLAGGTCNSPLPSTIAAIGFAPPPEKRGAVVCGPTPLAFTASVPPAAPPPTSPRPPKPPRTTPPLPPPPPPADGSAACPPMPACGLACPGGGLAHDARGCPRCACATGPSTAPPR